MSCTQEGAFCSSAAAQIFICCPKSTETVIAETGKVKAASSFLTHDPAYALVDAYHCSCASHGQRRLSRRPFWWPSVLLLEDMRHGRVAAFCNISDCWTFRRLWQFFFKLTIHREPAVHSAGEGSSCDAMVGCQSEQLGQVQCDWISACHR